METLICHAIASYLDENDEYKPPIYLAIQGPPGEGKTAQSIAACTQKGLDVIYVSASSLSGSHENEAREKFQKIYDYALQMSRERMAVIVIDEICQKTGDYMGQEPCGLHEKYTRDLNLELRTALLGLERWLNVAIRK